MIKAFLITQTVLLFIELFTKYDTAVRQLALSLTNLGATIGVLLLQSFLRRQGMKLSGLTIGLVAGSVWVDALGNFQHFYAAYWWYDRVTHAIGGLAVSALFIDLAQNYQLAKKWFISWWAAVWFGFMLGQFAAAMYEVSEWLGDWWFATERVRGLFDAPRDLFFNLVGGLVAVWLFWLIRKKKPT